MYMGKATKYVLSKMPMQEQLARAVEMENDVDKRHIAENQASKQSENNNIIEAEFSAFVSDERFEMLKQNIINKEVTLQELLIYLYLRVMNKLKNNLVIHQNEQLNTISGRIKS